MTLIVIAASTFGQDKSVQNLLDTASKSIGQFVKNVPLNNSRLYIGDTTEYKNYLSEVFQQTIYTKYLIEIIQNSKLVDTSIWLDIELPTSILTEGYKETVDFNYVLKKFKLTDKKQIRYYRKFVNDFNSDFVSRKFYYMSRPVFDNSKEYAVVTISNSFEGGMLTLFKKNGDTWHKLGNINRWRY
ncbi:hypothetical protein FW778_17950 [Ginsengibacter hankyongi]|uniref:Uncharacterized protein n=1 Tax=Ginsengibacter hankyongi TaxID=2607284 RepID=A0A5J5IFT7_9BACT|nr:hypothetical protein FW778_17950 [Ginsengibacter hankyongi]